MAKVTLSDGRVLNFNGTPTHADIEEAVSQLGAMNVPKMNTPSRERTKLEYLMPSWSTKYEEKPGERTLLGDIFERPGAAVRSAMRGKGYSAGAVRPEDVSTFQDMALDKYYAGKDFKGKTALGMGVSTLGMLADIATNPADLLTILAPKAPGASKVSKAIEVSKPGQAVSRFITKERHLPLVQTPKTAKALSQEQPAKLLMDVLRPGRSELKNKKIGRGDWKNIKDAVNVIAEEGAPIGSKMIDNRTVLDTSKAQIMVKDSIGKLDDVLTAKLRKTPGTKQYYDLQQEKKIALSIAARTKYLKRNPSRYKGIVKDIKSFYNDAINMHGRYIDAPNYNEVKRGWGEVGFNINKDTQSDAAKVASRVARKSIEKRHPDVKSINNAMSKYIKARDLLIARDGQVVSGGKLGKYFAQTTGTIVGSMVGSKVPIAGTLGGAVGGRMLAGNLYDILKSPQRILGIATKKAAQSGIMQKTMQEAISGIQGAIPVPRRGYAKVPSGTSQFLALLAERLNSGNDRR